MLCKINHYLRRENKVNENKVFSYSETLKYRALNRISGSVEKLQGTDNVP